MERFDDECKRVVCEQPVEDLGITRRPDPKCLMLVWRGGDAPTVSKWLCWDAAAAYMQAEHMAAFRDGDTVVLYSLNWQAQWWGHA